MMKKYNVVILILLLAIVSSCKENQKGKEANTDTAIAKESLPNIIYILADDMGYGDLSSLNPKSGIKTPNMDKIVQEGIQFTDAHSNSSVCTPTRYGVLTGRYAWRSRLKTGVLWGYDQPLIEDNRETVASYLKANGYNTACIGKWHLGLGWQAKDTTKPIAKYEWTKEFKKGDESNVDFSQKIKGPNTLGFDYSYIIPASLDMSPYLYVENEKAVELPTEFTEGRTQAKDGRGVFWRSGEVAPNFVFEDVLNNFTNRTVSYIDEQKDSDKPFFIYFPLSAPHTPWLPGEEVNGKSNAGRYGDFVTMVDNTVGAVTKALEKAGIAENTLVIVTSDNGSHWTLDDKKEFAHRANYVFKGQKADVYEGGHHIPYIAKWPKKIAPGSISNQVTCTTDLLATVAGIVGKPLAKDAGEDSYNMLPAYLNTKDTAQIRDYTIHHSLHGTFSIRKGKWKLTTKLGSGGFSEPVEITENGVKGSLFNMEEDIEETTNVYNEHPETVKELLALLESSK